MGRVLLVDDARFGDEKVVDSIARNVREEYPFYHVDTAFDVETALSAHNLPKSHSSWRAFALVMFQPTFAGLNPIDQMFHH